MSNSVLSEFRFMPNEYGWSAPLPSGSPCLFGKEVLLEISTRALHSDPTILPQISKNQGTLVGKLIPALPKLLRRVEEEMVSYNQKYDPDFTSFITHPHVWLNSEYDDGVSWTLVVERIDNPDFGYHAEFKGLDFIELWAGD